MVWAIRLYMESQRMFWGEVLRWPAAAVDAINGAPIDVAALATPPPFEPPNPVVARQSFEKIDAHLQVA